MIDLWIAKHTGLLALPTKKRLLFSLVALAKRPSRLLTENIHGLPAAFCEAM